jgi:serine/threonine-protein kinase
MPSASATTVGAVEALSGLSGIQNATQVTSAVRAGGPPTSAGGQAVLPPPGSRRAQRSNSRNKVTFWVLAAIGLILLCTAAWALFLRDQTPEVTQTAVPDVVGQTFDEASTQLEAANFQVEKTEIADDTVAEGDVISQDPSSGTMLDPGATVTLTVSLGKEKISIPRLSGYTYDDAKDLLESDQYGLQVEKSEQDSSAPEDEVINSNPPEGTEVDKGSTVTLLVSKGEQTVPDVVGQSVSSATSELENAGFDVKVSGPDDGIVTDQDPSDGDTAKKGSKVKITSKKKPDDNPTPDDSASPEEDNP